MEHYFDGIYEKNINPVKVFHQESISADIRICQNAPTPLKLNSFSIETLDEIHRHSSLKLLQIKLIFLPQKEQNREFFQFFLYFLPFLLKYIDENHRI